MKTKVEICHIDSNRCVVRVSGIEGEQDLGSSLGEADDAEQAEDGIRYQPRSRGLGDVYKRQNNCSSLSCCLDVAPDFD